MRTLSFVQFIKRLRSVGSLWTTLTAQANHAPLSAAHCPPGAPPLSNADLQSARAAAYHASVQTKLTADVLALKKRGINVDVYVVQDASCVRTRFRAS